MSQKFITIDGNALVHRAFHALPPLTTKEGRLVNAVYGFLSILFKVYNELKPDYIALTFDKAEKTFRDELYQDYKAQREKAPDELYEQIPVIKEFAKAMNIPILEKSGFEADDLIGSIVNQIKAKDLEHVIVTGDLDLLQLVDKRTKVFTLRRGITDTVIYDAKEVSQRYNGLKPDQLVDYKAIKGDPSDNIPGIAGIGEKGAIDLLLEYESLDNIYLQVDKHPEKFKKSILEKLRESKEIAYLSQELAKIITDLKISQKLNDFKVRPLDRDKFEDMLLDYNFKSLISRLLGKADNLVKPKEKAVPVLKSAYKEVIDEQDFVEFNKNTGRDLAIALHLNQDDGQILGISLAVAKGRSYYFSIKRITTKSLFDKEDSGRNHWLDKLKPILEKSEIIGHDLKAIYKKLLESGISLTNLDFDTKLGSYLLNPGSRQDDLQTLAYSELKIRKLKPESILNPKKAADYFNQEADIVYQLKNCLINKLKADDLLELYQTIEIPLIKILAKMETHGVVLDKEFLRSLAKTVNKDIEKLTAKIFKLAGHELNISSPQQLKVVLFDELEIATKGLAKTKTGISTAAAELEKLKGVHPIIDLISQYRELTKLKTTYIDALPKLADADNRIHTTYNQTVTSTGRLSSTNPNLQNIPVRTELGKRIRQAFVAPDGHKLLAADYSQIELRIIAHIAQEKNMIDTFKKNQDIHKKTAALINNVKLENVTREMRYKAKAVNFGIIYGMGARGLAQSAEIDYKEAKEFIEKYFESYPKIKKYVERTKEKAREDGYVETLFGRKRYLPEIHSGVQMIRASAERMAINMPIQGTSADLIKLAMIEIDKKLERITFQSKMILQVHDELVFEVPEKDLKKVGKFIKDVMENIYKLSVPIVVDVSLGRNWGEMKDL